VKFKIETEIDWIDEECNVDDAIQQEIKNDIISKVTTNMTKKIEASIEGNMAEKITKLVDDVSNNMIGSFLERKISITDKWGKEIISDTSIEKILKTKLEEFWMSKVDDKGRSGYNSYGKVLPRFEWMVDEKVKKQSERFAKELTTDTIDKIKTHVTEEMKEMIGQKFVKEFGVKALIEKQ